MAQEEFTRILRDRRIEHIWDVLGQMVFGFGTGFVLLFINTAELGFWEYAFLGLLFLVPTFHICKYGLAIYQTSQDIKNKEVIEVALWVEKKIDVDTENAVYTIFGLNKKWQVSKEAYQEIMPGSQVNLIYAKHSNTFLDYRVQA